MAGKHLTDAEAAATALRHLLPASACYDPVVVKVEDAGDSWRVFYNNRAYVETGKLSEALAGNWPKLVHKETGAVTDDEAYRRHFLRLDEG